MQEDLGNNLQDPTTARGRMIKTYDDDYDAQEDSDYDPEMDDEEPPEMMLSDRPKT